MEKRIVALPNDVESFGVHMALAHLATARSATISRANGRPCRQVSSHRGIRRGTRISPGVMHIWLHAMTFPRVRRNRSIVTRRTIPWAPNNAHALHMPTHIYTRLGDWERGRARHGPAPLVAAARGSCG